MNKYTGVLICALGTMLCLAGGLELSAEEQVDWREMNEQPMYGNKRFTEEQQKLNDYVVSSVIKQAGTKQAALEHTIKVAWQYF